MIISGLACRSDRRLSLIHGRYQVLPVVLETASPGSVTALHRKSMYGKEQDTAFAGQNMLHSCTVCLPLTVGEML